MIREAILSRISDLALTQKDVSHYTGIAQQNICAYLNGSRSFSLPMTIKIMSALGLSIDDKSTSVGKYPIYILPEIIKNKCIEKEMSQKSLAELCGISEPTMSQFFNRHCNLSVASVEKVLDALNLKVVCFGKPQILEDN